MTAGRITSNAPGVGPTYLVLDTADQRGACALSSRDAVITSRTWPSSGGHAEQLLPALQALLADNSIALSALDGVIVNIGPGSFTGVRAAVATAKALSMAPGLPIVGIDALHALAMAATTDGRPRVALLDARRDELFVAVYAAAGDALHAPSLIANTALPALADGFLPALVVASPDVLAAIGRDGVSPTDDDRLASLAKLGAARLARGDADDAAALEPLYVRPPDLSLPKARRGP